MASGSRVNGLETEEKEQGISATALAVGAVAALAAWGISKWLGTSDPDPQQKVKMMKKPGRDGYMPRPDFEGSPKTYFRNLRHKN